MESGKEAATWPVAPLASLATDGGWSVRPGAGWPLTRRILPTTRLCCKTVEACILTLSGGSGQARCVCTCKASLAAASEKKLTNFIPKKYSRSFLGFEVFRGQISVSDIIQGSSLRGIQSTANRWMQ